MTTMQIKDVKLTLLKTHKRQGVAKNDKPYLFYTGTFIDEDARVCDLKFSSNLTDQSIVANEIITAKSGPVEVDINLYPSGFKFNGVITRIDYI